MKSMILAIALSAAFVATAAPKKEVATKSAPAGEAAFDPVASFQELVSRGSTPSDWTAIVQIPNTGKWVKQTYHVGETRYDVKKTDSLVTPIIGTVTFTFMAQASPQYPTEAEAEASSEFVKLRLLYSVEGRFLPLGKVWKLDQFKYTDIESSSPLRGSVRQVDEAKIRSDNRGAVIKAMARFLPVE